MCIYVWYTLYMQYVYHIRYNETPQRLGQGPSDPWKAALRWPSDLDTFHCHSYEEWLVAPAPFVTGTWHETLWVHGNSGNIMDSDSQMILFSCKTFKTIAGDRCKECDCCGCLTDLQLLWLWVQSRDCHKGQPLWRSSSLTMNIAIMTVSGSLRLQCLQVISSFFSSFTLLEMIKTGIDCAKPTEE